MVLTLRSTPPKPIYPASFGLSPEPETVGWEVRGTEKGCIYKPVPLRMEMSTNRSFSNKCLFIENSYEFFIFGNVMKNMVLGGD